MFRDEWGLSKSYVKRFEDHKWKKRFDDLFIELTGSAVTTLIGTGIGFLLAQKTIQQLLVEPIFWFHIVVVTLLGWGLIHFVRRSQTLKKQFMNLQEKDQLQNSKLVKFNIQHIYPNREACDPIIQEKIKSSSVIKFFLLLGSDFSGKSIVYLPAFQAKPAGNAEVQILISALDSPFLSEARLKSINKDKKDIRLLLNDVKKELRKLEKKMEEKKVIINWREHKENFLCKFHLFDDCVIFCFNIVTSDNDNVSPYFVIKKNEDQSIYNAFKKYFDFVWNRSDKPQKPN